MKQRTNIPYLLYSSTSTFSACPDFSSGRGGGEVVDDYTPFAFSGGLLAGTEFMFGKAVISASTQAIINKGNVDVFDVGADALLTPGASRLFGSAIDIRHFSKDKFKWIGGDKSLGEFGLNAGTKYIYGKIGSSAYNQVSPLLQNSTEKAIFYNVISIPTSVFGKGLNKATNK